jgi:hypothetical protein
MEQDAHREKKETCSEQKEIRDIYKKGIKYKRQNQNIK